jgi:hypothetical protein
MMMRARALILNARHSFLPAKHWKSFSPIHSRPPKVTRSHPKQQQKTARIAGDIQFCLILNSTLTLLQLCNLVQVAPSIAARVVESARGVLNHLIPDVFIYTDHYKGRDAGASPGFGCSLAAESTEGVVLRYRAGASISIAGVGGQKDEIKRRVTVDSMSLRQSFDFAKHRFKSRVSGDEFTVFPRPIV